MERFDVTVIGGGPSGMAAALAASEEGASVLLLETDSMLGGILNQCIHNGFGLHYFGVELTGPEYADRFRQLVEQSGITVLLDTLVIDVSRDKVVTAVSREKGLLSIRAGAVVFSTGCSERPRGAIGIPGTRPAGILTAGAAQKYMNRMGYQVGSECVILGSGDIGLIMARRLTLEGARVRAVVELMPYTSGLPRNVKQCLDDFDIPLLLSHTVVEIKGKERISGVVIAEVDENRVPIPGTEETIACDMLLLSVGLIPSTDLALGMGVEVMGSNVMVDQHFETGIAGVFICGNTLHVHDLVDYVTEESLTAGRYAARHALGSGTSGHLTAHIRPSAGITYTVPQTIRGNAEEEVTIRFRTNRVYRNVRVVLSADGREIAAEKRKIMVPGEMQTFKVKAGRLNGIRGEITAEIKEAAL